MGLTKLRAGQISLMPWLDCELCLRRLFPSLDDHLLLLSVSAELGGGLIGFLEVGEVSYPLSPFPFLS